MVNLVRQGDSYISRHRPTHHVIVTPNVGSTSRYARFYDITYDLIKRGDFPVVAKEARQRTFRTLGPKHRLGMDGSPVQGKKEFFSIDEARTVPPNSANSTDKRYSGVRLDGTPGASGLYVGSLAAFAREHFHYATRVKETGLLRSGGSGPLLIPGQPDKLHDFIKDKLAATAPVADANDKFYAYAYNRHVELADLRVTTVYRSFARYLDDPKARARYGVAHTPIDFLVREIFSLFDYSASRGAADAIFDLQHVMGVEGLCTTSSRGETDTGVVLGLTGAADADNQFLFGRPSNVVSSLTPLKLTVEPALLKPNVEAKPSANAVFDSIGELVKNASRLTG